MYYLVELKDKYLGYVLTMSGKKFVNSDVLPDEPYVAWILPDNRIVIHVNTPEELASIVLSNIYCISSYVLEHASPTYATKNVVDFGDVKLNEYTIAGYKFYSKMYSSNLYINPEVVAHQEFDWYYGSCCGSLYKGSIVNLVKRRMRIGMLTYIDVFDIYYNNDYITTCRVGENIIECLKNSYNLKLLSYEITSEILCKYSVMVGLWS